MCNDWTKDNRKYCDMMKTPKYFTVNEKKVILWRSWKVKGPKIKLKRIAYQYIDNPKFIFIQYTSHDTSVVDEPYDQEEI